MKLWIGLICMCSMLATTGTSFAMNRMTEAQPLVLIMMGPPGAGKGTHATSLSAHLAVPHISTGDLFRENIRNQTPLGKIAKGHIDNGKLVPDELVLDMLFDRIQREDCKRGYILDGFPRTVPQAEALDQRLKAHRIVAVNFEIADATIVERLSGRLSCKCGRTFHVKFDLPKKAGLCDGCSGALYQRDDDKEEIILKRLEVYRAQTEPVIAYYAKKSEVLFHVDSEQARDEVFQDVLKSIPALAY